MGELRTVVAATRRVRDICEYCNRFSSQYRDRRMAAGGSMSPKEKQLYVYDVSISGSVSAEKICAIALCAGDKIMEVYNEMGKDKESAKVNVKSDSSPVTRADLLANDVIVSSLQSLYPHIPIITEEATKQQSYDCRRNYKYFFCVDPLDGTKEFLKMNGQFTVNIALVEGNLPCLGVVYVPAQKKMYWAV